MALPKKSFVSITWLACLIVLLSITTGCKKINPGVVEIKPTGVIQKTLQPSITLPTPSSGETLPVPAENNKRTEVITYTIQSGDTIFGIAEKFDIKPETILWGNPHIFEDLLNVSITPGIVLNILPVDGAYHSWKLGEDLNEVAKKYGVSTQVIINWPGNHLDPKTLGAYSSPNIEPGTMLFIPGGNLPFPDFSPPKTETNQP